jgi:hypothetical protein
MGGDQVKIGWEKSKEKANQLPSRSIEVVVEIQIVYVQGNFVFEHPFRQEGRETGIGHWLENKHPMGAKRQAVKKIQPGRSQNIQPLNPGVQARTISYSIMSHPAIFADGTL